MFKSIIVISITFLFSCAESYVLKTGQTVEYKTGDNGTYHALTGVERSYSRDNINGIVSDHSTNLQWQDYYEEGKIYRTDWTAANTYCTKLHLKGVGWRLPTRYELTTIVDYSQSHPAINTTFFQATASGTYWSSTSYMKPESANAWRTNFNDGGDYVSKKENVNFVRCVRGAK